MEIVARGPAESAGGCLHCWGVWAAMVSLLALCAPAWAQPSTASQAPSSAKPEAPQDPLGRTTPRGTLIGFLTSARKGESETAVQYLNTRLRGEAAARLANQLSVVLDRRLPARLERISDRPEGSLVFPTRPDQDLIGTISSGSGEVQIVVERVNRGKAGTVWLFARKTLDSIPGLYEEVNAVPVENIVPEFLVATRIADVPLYNWLAFFAGMPLFYWFATLLNRAARRLAGRLLRSLRKKADLPDPPFLPAPIRLLLLAGTIRWTLSKASLPLLGRQFWFSTANVITIAACVWLFIRLNGWAESRVRRRLVGRNLAGAFSFLHVARRAADLLAIFVGLLVGLRLFGVNISAALAGLGIGGIAVALAAQKTLENVIAGISLISDRAVSVGDFLRVDGAIGTVENIGLRSTRIRTLERTVLSVPNGQIANTTVENFTLRDKCWFHHSLGLRYETTASQLDSVVKAVRVLLRHHPVVEGDSVRVRFLRFGTSSLDVDVVAYVLARDWNHFLEVQEDLLLQVMDAVRVAGTKIALPSQATYLVTPPASNGASVEELVQALASDKKPADAMAPSQF